MYINKLNNIVTNYNNTYHSQACKDVKSSTYTDFDKNNNREDPKLKDGDHVRISKYKNIFPKVFVPNWFEEVSEITKIKNTVTKTDVINDLNCEEIVERFTKKI